MSITKNYNFDIDTKRYLNRVNTYRLLNGLPNITSSDALDIDNFIIGLKDLQLWGRGEIWLMSSKYNVGAGQVVSSLSNSTKIGLSVGGTTWQTDGIRSTGVGAPPPYIQLQNTKKTNYFTRNIIHIFIRDAFTTDDVYLLTCNYSHNFAGSGGGFFSAPVLQWGVSLDRTQLIQSISGGQRTCISTVLAFDQVHSFKNGTSKNTATRVPFPITDTNSIRCMAMQGGSLTNRGLNGVMSLAADFDHALSDTDQLGFYNLCKQTIGKDLGLP